MCASSFGPRLWNLQKQGKINRGFAWIKTTGLSTHGLCQCSAWLACVCAQLKITISIYLYQRGREKKTLHAKEGDVQQILQIWRQPSSTLTRGHSSRVNNPLTWALLIWLSLQQLLYTKLVQKSHSKHAVRWCSTAVIQLFLENIPGFLIFGLGNSEIGFLKQTVWKHFVPPNY